MTRRGAWALALAVTTGCATPRVSLRGGPRVYVADNYEDVLRQWTREGNTYTLRRLDNPLSVTATYESWDFRWAYVVRYAADFRLSTQDRAHLLEASLDASQREHEFYVTLYTSSPRWGDLTRPTSAWRVLLVTDEQHEVAPLAIEPIRRPSALERTYFPYTTPWRQAFRIRFPRTVVVPGRGEIELLNATTKYFLLRFSGPLGSTDLVWQVE